MLLADMHDTVNAMTAFVTVLMTAVPIIVAAIVKILLELEKLRKQTENTFHGQLGRGFIEARQKGCLAIVDGQMVVSGEARLIFCYIQERLVSVYEKAKKVKGSIPTDDELGFAMEQDRSLQDWIIANACETLRLKAYGCLAVACAMIREYVPEAKYTRPPSDLMDKETVTP